MGNLSEALQYVVDNLELGAIPVVVTLVNGHKQETEMSAGIVRWASTLPDVTSIELSHRFYDIVTHFEMMAKRTIVDRSDLKLTTQQINLLGSAVSIGGEAGEILEMAKKHCFHGHPLDDEKLQKEAGDLAWYLAELSDRRGWHLSIVFAKVIEKLFRRYPAGFTSHDSLHRTE